MNEPAHHSINELVSRQTQLLPHRIAVACGNHKITYQLLENQSTQLVLYLIKSAVGLKRCEAQQIKQHYFLNFSFSFRVTLQLFVGFRNALVQPRY